jgi:hypothetical protein
MQATNVFVSRRVVGGKKKQQEWLSSANWINFFLGQTMTNGRQGRRKGTDKN